MPGPGIHFMVADKLLQKLGSSSESTLNDLAQIAQSNPQMFYLGAVGPDLWAFSDVPDYVSVLKRLEELGRPLKQARDDISAAREKHTPLGDIQALVERCISIVSNADACVNWVISLPAVPFITILGPFGSPLAKDIGFTEEYWKWSDMLHARRTGVIASRLWKESASTPAARAFALGYLSHIGTDVTGHAFVNAIVRGPARGRGLVHHVVENHMDVAMWAGSSGDINSAHLEDYLPQELKPTFTDMVNTSINAVYCKKDSPYPKNGHNAQMVDNALQVFQTAMSFVTGACSVLPPVEPSAADIKKVISDMYNDAASAIHKVVDRHRNGGVPSLSWNFDLMKFLKALEDQMLALLQDLLDMARLFMEEVAKAIHLQIATTTTLIEAYLYQFEVMMYGLQRLLRFSPSRLGLLYPAMDEVDSNWFVITDPAATYPERSLSQGDQLEWVLTDFAAARATPPSSTVENPSTIAGPYQRGDNPWAFVEQAVQGSDLELNRWFSCRTPAATATCENQLSAGQLGGLGNAVDLTVELIRKVNDGLPNFNLDSDRGYGSKCWCARWKEGTNPSQNPLLVDPVDVDYVL